MTLECSVCAAFHRWMEEKEEPSFRQGLLVELSFLDGFVKEKGAEGIFSSDFTKNPRRLERMMGTVEFRRYLDRWVDNQELEEGIAEELRWRKWEQLMQAAAFYVRFLKSYKQHRDRKMGKRHVRTRPSPKEGEELGRETIRALSLWLHIPPSSMKKLAASLPPGGKAGPDALWGFLPFRRMVQLKVFDLLDIKGEMTLQDMEEEWAHTGLGGERMKEALSFLCERKLAVKGQEGYVRTCFDVKNAYPSAQCFLESMSSERYRLILSMRLDGCSLKAIGEKLFITRERVRQIAARLFEKRPHLSEDELAPEWQKYRSLGPLYFRFLFNVPQCTVNYLSAVYGRGVLLPPRERQILLKEIEEGMAFPPPVRERARFLLL